MALYRFQIGRLDLRVESHPSATREYLITRVVAYALHHREGIRFSPGVCVGEEPPVAVIAADGRYELWVEVGSPSSGRLRKAASAAAQVEVFCHEDPQCLLGTLQELPARTRSRIRVRRLDADWVREQGADLQAFNRWELNDLSDRAALILPGEGD